MPKKTYTQINSVTLAAASSSITFDSIPQNFRDLILVLDGTRTGDNNILYRFNGDSGSNYSTVYSGANGSTTLNQSETGAQFYVTQYALTTNSKLNSIFQVMDYSATDKHKSILMRFNQPASNFAMIAGRWANTAAVTSIRVLTGNADFGAGSTFTLYGIEA
jgi:hypothetical protein